MVSPVPEFTTKVNINLKRQGERLEFMDKRMLALVTRAAQAFSAFLLRRVTKDKLRGQVLNRVTGNLIRDVTASRFLEVSEATVTAGIGTSLRYGIALEEGFKGRVQVKAHTRTLVEQARSKASGRRVKKALKKKRQRTAFVRAHTRKMDIVARHYLRDTLLENQEKAPTAVRRAILLALRTGKLPPIGKLLPN